MSRAVIGRHSFARSSKTVQPSARAVRMTDATSAASASRCAPTKVPLACGDSTERGHRGPRERRTADRIERAVGAQRLVRRLRARLLLNHDAEDGVHPVEDRGHRAEVRDERQSASESLARVEVRGDARAAEAVDRLLRVADDEQRAGWHGRRLASPRQRPPARPRSARRARSESGRCPGTRPAAAVGTSPAARPVRRRSSAAGRAMRRADRGTRGRRMPRAHAHRRAPRRRSSVRAGAARRRRTPSRPRTRRRRAPCTRS